MKRFTAYLVAGFLVVTVTACSDVLVPEPAPHGDPKAEVQNEPSTHAEPQSPLVGHETTSEEPYVAAAAEPGTEPAPATDEPATDEPATDEPATEEPAADDPAVAPEAFSAGFGWVESRAIESQGWTLQTGADL